MKRSIFSSSEIDDQLIMSDIEEIDYDLIPNTDLQPKRKIISQSAPTTPQSHNNNCNLRISLPPDNNITNQITNELFQVTSNLRLKQKQQKQQDDINESIDPNSKLYNLMKDLKQLENSDYEMDDITRTRVFSNRFTNSIDQINPDLSKYFQIHEDNTNEKESITTNKPFKVKKKSLTSLTRRKSLPLIETNNIPKKSPLYKKQSQTILLHGLCKPNNNLKPSKSCFNLRESSIFLIESSTGFLNDATKFATELNGSRNDNLPYPEHENEVVQIPTNNLNNDNLIKMAIIRMIKKQWENDQKSRKRVGFYSENEFQSYKQNNLENSTTTTPKIDDTNSLGVELVSQSNIDNEPKNKTVRWADNLEW
ncbi:hypothetical protein KGF54_000356 [Candida jiufengensis]|uniref:uncharacterized protein n=1 Tax=Candida jiufengensis TaxID=497108 RepID=UPI0022248196|nr:uncharacterized protein KGF54_000356 [Candida jiufengensis]KAI5956739.1 hypothetical protein KGF54_000356 [Candida jiufengensis]